MKLVSLVLSYFFFIGLSLIADEVVSIWSKGAGAFLSSKGRVLQAKSNTIGKDERFILRKIDSQNAGMLSLMTPSKKQLGDVILEDLGNSFFAFKGSNGTYLSCAKDGKLRKHEGKVGDNEIFSVVPIRKGAKVCVRAYQGWEAKLHIDHPAEFPTLRTNVNTLQITPLLDPPHKKFYTKEILSDYRKSFSTNAWETEYILNKSPEEIKANPRRSNLKGLLGRVILMESLGYEVDYLIVYREPLVEGHAPGPWSDKRILAQSDVDAVNEMFKEAYAKKKVKHKSYRLVALAYQFDTKPANDTFVGDLTAGLDDETRAFIKKNFWGVSFEINSHDYAKKKEHIDTAMAAEWAKANDLELVITSGGSGKDRGFKKMYELVFSEFEKRGVDQASPWIHYVLHHVFQKKNERFPEWEKDTTAQNAKWLIEKVQHIQEVSHAN